MKIPKNVSSGGVHEDPHQPMAYSYYAQRSGVEPKNWTENAGDERVGDGFPAPLWLPSPATLYQLFLQRI